MVAPAAPPLTPPTSDHGDAPSGPTARQRATLALIVLWIAIGLAIDTRRHRTDDRLDTFFTSAHALLYTGWVAGAVFLLYVARKRQERGERPIARGFEAASAGAVLFGIGGIGDLIWHTAFGIERQLKILFSPTHLLLMSAMLMMSFGPIRSLWATSERPTARTLWPAALSAGVITSVLLVFFQYVSSFERGIFTADIPKLLGLDEIVRVQSIAGVVILTVLFFGPVLLLARRWRLPFGTSTLAFAVPAASNYIFTDFKTPKLCIAMVAGGLVADAVIAVVQSTVRGSTTRSRTAYRMIGALAPLSFWGTYAVITVVGHTLRWPAELWTGTLLWSALIGLGLTVLLLPPVDTPSTWLDREAAAG